MLFRNPVRLDHVSIKDCDLVYDWGGKGFQFRCPQTHQKNQNLFIYLFLALSSIPHCIYSPTPPKLDGNLFFRSCHRSSIASMSGF